MAGSAETIRHAVEGGAVSIFGTKKLGHPSRFSDSVLAEVDRHLPDGALTLDPFAGVGRIHELRPRVTTFGVEIEPEWGTQHPATLVGNALRLPFPDATFDAIATSPVYGNRMSDHHNAADTSKRITYKHTLGRDLHPDNSGQLQWGPSYRGFHRLAWLEALRVLRPGGDFVLNISDHIRKGEVAQVVYWHRLFLKNHGCSEMCSTQVGTPRMRYGANGEIRVTGEAVIHFVKA